MQKMFGWKRLALVLCALFLLAACGQKGSLYMPEGKAVATLAG